MRPACQLINTKDKLCQFYLNKHLDEMIEGINKNYDRIAVVCIGTDSCTGDSFGPLVGHFLSKLTIYDFDLYGTIHKPVHAVNLVDTLKNIDIDNTLVIGVDASLGASSHVGSISIGRSPIKPGSSMGRTLPEVGDVHIAGIVNVSGLMPLMVLQNTRLGMVYTMAEISARAIHYILYKRLKKKDTAWYSNII